MGLLGSREVFLESGQNEKTISDYKAAAKLGDSGAQMFLKSKGVRW